MVFTWCIYKSYRFAGLSLFLTLVEVAHSSTQTCGTQLHSRRENIVHMHIIVDGQNQYPQAPPKMLGVGPGDEARAKCAQYVSWSEQ